MRPRIDRLLARWSGLLLLFAWGPVAYGKGVSGTPQQPHRMGSVSTADANDLTNASTATPQDEALAKAAAALEAAADKVRDDFEQTPAWTDAAAAYSIARDTLAADTAAAIDKLAANADYGAAVAARDKAQTDLDALHASATATSQDFVTAAKNALAARAAVTALQAQAISADPAIAQDRPKLAAALKTMNELRVQEQKAVQVDQNWKSDMETYEAAKIAAASGPK